MVDIKKVMFAGNEIECVEVFGRIYVSVKDLCRGIGLDYMTQLTIMRGIGWDVRAFKRPSGEIMNTIGLEDIQAWLDLLSGAIKHKELIEKNEKEGLFKNIEFND